MRTTRVLNCARRKLGMLLAMVLCAMTLSAAEVVATLTGIVRNGRDTFGIFGVGPNLNGQPFVAVFTFDDRKGKPQPPGNTCPDAGTGIEGAGPDSPGKATITIAGKTLSFGATRFTSSDVLRNIATKCSESVVIMNVYDRVIPLETYGINISVFPKDPKRPITTDPDWRTPVATTNVAGSLNTNGFGFTRVGDYWHATGGTLEVETLTIVRK